MDLYIVLMYRYGDTKSHSYLLGVYDDLTEAIINARSERIHRTGKYEAQILKTKLNETKNRQIMFKEDFGEMSKICVINFIKNAQDAVNKCI